MREEKVLARASFDTKLQTYWMLTTILALTVCFVGIPIVPFWLIFGWGIHKKQFESLECELTERSLNIRRGFLFRVEKNIPLDKIQDVAMKEGPILRKLGLAALGVETAGNSVQGQSDATLTGVIDAPSFRDAILNQRDLVAGATAVAAAPATVTPAADPVLVEIRDSLLRIEGMLGRKDGKG